MMARKKEPEKESESYEGVNLKNVKINLSRCWFWL
jgi:hypothetical protein